MYPLVYLLLLRRETVNTHMLNMKQALRRTNADSASSTEARRRLQLGVEAAYTVTHSIAITNEVLPVRIFGMVASARMSALILYGLLVFLYVLFQYSLSGTITLPT
jgi:hypothetical protein